MLQAILPSPSRVEQVGCGARLLRRGDQIGIDRRGEEIDHQRVPVAARVLERGRILVGLGGNERLDQAGLHQRRRRIDAVEHVALYLAGAGLAHDLDGGRAAVGAHVVHLDPRILLVEGLDQRTHRLVDDERGVPDDLALPASGLVERGVGRVAGIGGTDRGCGACENDGGPGRPCRIPARLALLAEARDPLQRLRRSWVVRRLRGERFTASHRRSHVGRPRP